MAQITRLMQAMAAFDAARQEMAWVYGDRRLVAYVDRVFSASWIGELRKRCTRVLLEEEEAPPMVMILESRSIGDWLTLVEDVAADMRALARRGLLGDTNPGPPGYRELIARMMMMTVPCLARKVKTATPDTLVVLEGKCRELGYTDIGLPLATCCTEQPSSAGQQSANITDVPLGRERDDDRQRIIGIITQQAAESRETETDEPVILPIVGPAGIGKKTLVKSIFNDPKLFQDYAKAWVDTLEGKDLKKIYTSIIRSSQALLGGGESPPLWNDDYSVDDMKNQLAELFRSGNKKLLLVLDNLWLRGADLYRMDDLKSLLCGIGRNVVVIVTTPSKSVAGYITSNFIKPHQLHPLSHDTCWEIMKRTSGFEARNDEEAETAERIGREIASKCHGLPLAAKALGRTLRSVDNPQHWSAVVGDSQGIWNTGLGLHTLAVLSHLKQAYRLFPHEWLSFATCAFCFSKGRSISRYDLECQCLALCCVSAVCHDPASRLLGHSLLRENSASNASAVLKDEMLLSVDDMMYDFARYLLGDRLMVVDGRRNDYLAKRSSNAYLAVISNWDANQRLDLSIILPAGILALRFEDCPAKMELSDDAFGAPSAKHLRVLDLSGCCSLKKLPESIGELKSLRYLKVPGIQDRVLPVWLTRLHKLRYLSLRGSPLLSDLTEAFGRLEELRHLDLSGCSGLKALPDSFGEWLEDLSHLDLSGCSGLKALPDSFGWLLYLSHVDLSGCSGLKALPDWTGGLKQLKHLNLSGCSCVRGITEALQRSIPRVLRYLNLSHGCGYSSVEDWFHLKDLDKVLPKLTELRFLGLSSCLNPLCYTSTPDKSKDYVDLCISDLVKLQHLDLSHNKFLVQLPESMGNLKELRSLDLSGCFRLDRLPERIGELKKLETLDLSGCFRIDRLPERIGELKKLETLDLSGCTQLGSLPENVQQKLAKLRTQGSLTIITDHKVSHLCQAGAHEDQSQERSIVAGDDQAQGGASTPQDASFVDPSSAAEPEIIAATDPDQ